MAKLKINPLFAGISGTLGDLVFKQTKDGQTIVSKRPRTSGAKPSEAQRLQRERFKVANAYARAALADPALRATYEAIAEESGTSAYSTARDDYFRGNGLLSSPLPSPK